MADTVEQLIPSSFGQLKDLVREILDRGGDSVTTDTLAGTWVNAAEKYICSEIGAPKFLQHDDTLAITGSTNEYTLPVNVADIQTLTDRDNLFPLTYVQRHKWSNYIVDPGNATGTPTSWTKWGHDRRDNTESPSREYGALKIAVFPTPSSSTTLYYDCILRPGTMINDSDFPVIPIEYHYGIIQVALMLAGPYDIGVKAYRQNVDLTNRWLKSVIRSERRDLAGNIRFTHVSEHGALRGQNLRPITRRNQLGYR